jgi:hypothetical protein
MNWFKRLFGRSETNPDNQHLHDEIIRLQRSLDQMRWNKSQAIRNIKERYQEAMINNGVTGLFPRTKKLADHTVKPKPKGPKPGWPKGKPRGPRKSKSQVLTELLGKK